MADLSFNVDRTKANEGDYITVSWDCSNPDMVSLSVEDGTKTIYQLGDSGSRSIKVSGESDRINLTLSASTGGKVERRTLSVKVDRKVARARKVKSSPKPSSSKKRKLDFGKVGEWWRKSTADLKTVWGFMPSDKKLAYKVLCFLAVLSILSAFSPKLLSVGVLAIGLYLMWFILKRH